MRRRKLLAAVALVLTLAGVTLLGTWPLAEQSQLSKEAFGRIEVQRSSMLYWVSGMSRSEVEAILGPAGDYRTGPTFHEPHARTTFASSTNRVHCTTLAWQGDAGLILITLDSSGKSLNKVWYADLPVAHDPITMLVWRAKRRFYRWLA